MVYVEIKKINGKLYRYQRKSIRIGKRIKKIYVGYLGPLKKVKKDDKKK
jgi:hypothetical protein